MGACLFGLTCGGAHPAGRPLSRQLRRRIGGDQRRLQSDRYPRGRERAVAPIEGRLGRTRQQMWQEGPIADMLELLRPGQEQRLRFHGSTLA